MIAKLKYILCIFTVACIFFFQGLQSPAIANEMWVPPSVLPAGKVVGNWVVTGTGSTHFSFVVPDDYQGLPEAKVVVLGQSLAQQSQGIVYDLQCSIAAPGSVYNSAG